MRNVDAMIFPRWIAPVQPAGVVYREHALVLDRCKIVDCCPPATARQTYSASATYERPYHLLIT